MANRPCPFCGTACEAKGRTFQAGLPFEAWVQCISDECEYRGPIRFVVADAWVAHNEGPVHAVQDRDAEWRAAVDELAGWVSRQTYDRRPIHAHKISLRLGGVIRKMEGR